MSSTNAAVFFILLFLLQCAMEDFPEFTILLDDYNDPLVKDYDVKLDYLYMNWANMDTKTRESLLCELRKIECDVKVKHPDAFPKDDLASEQNNGCYANCKENDNNCQNKAKGNTFWETVKETAAKASGNELFTFGVKTAMVATATIVAAPAVIGAAGFGAAGVAAGSAAAAAQSMLFGGTISGLTGAAFSGLTSIGAAGLGLGGKLALVTGSGSIVKYFSGSAGDSKCASEKSADKDK